jgi:hypothetical protein
MTAGPALPCPHCKHVLGPEAWIDAGAGVCLRCKTRFDFTGFPALYAAPVKVTPQAAVLAADSVCFFHAENRAEALCDSCGRLLCAVCAVPFGGRRLCPTCIATNRTAGAAATVRQRLRFDAIALALVLYPLLLFIFWFLTCITAPLALGIVIYAWKKPGSLVRPGRVRLTIAGTLAALQIGAWIAFLVFLWVR